MWALSFSDPDVTLTVLLQCMRNESRPHSRARYDQTSTQGYQLYLKVLHSVEHYGLKLSDLSLFSPHEERCSWRSHKTHFKTEEMNTYFSSPLNLLSAVPKQTICLKCASLALYNLQDCPQFDSIITAIYFYFHHIYMLKLWILHKQKHEHELKSPQS